MILVTGGTGFIGQVLIRHLVAMGLQVRTLLRPSNLSPNLPRGVPVEAVICGLSDERGLRAAFRGVEMVYHLAGAERQGVYGDMLGVDIGGTRTIAQVAADVGIQRFFYLSHLGADRASAYTLLQNKAIAESHVTHSGAPYTIFRTGVVYGPGDQFTIDMLKMLRFSPGVFFLPAGGTSKLQPIWVEDLVTSLTLAMDDDSTRDQVYAIGGPEYLTFREVIETIQSAAGVRRVLTNISPAYLRLLIIYSDYFWRRFPRALYWLQYLAADRTCELDTLPRQFGLLPVRFARQLDYLAPPRRRLSGLLDTLKQRPGDPHR